MKKFYAFEFYSGRNTTTGQPNRTTGSYSTAGSLAVFPSSAQRDEWVKNGRVTSGMRGNCREIITAKDARALCAGMTLSDFDMFVEWCLDRTIEENEAAE